MIIFSGTSNLNLSKRIAKKINIDLGDIEIKRFLDLECRIWIKEKVEGKDVFVIQSLSIVADQNLMELCLIGNACKTLKAKSITAVIPWLGYSKQDKEFRKGESVSSLLVAKFIETAGFSRVITLELHSELIKKYFSIPIIELTTKNLLSSEIKNLDSCMVISPDKGGITRSDAFAKYLNLPVAHLEKSRDLSTGSVKILGIDKKIEGKKVVIFDDMINTGSTALETAKFLRKKGCANIIFLSTHAILSGNANERLQESEIDKIIVTDTIDIPKQKLFPKLKIISVANLLAENLR